MVTTFAWNIKTSGSGAHAVGDGRLITATISTSTTGGVTTLSAVENLFFTSTGVDTGKPIGFQLEGWKPDHDGELYDNFNSTIATILSDRSCTLTTAYTGTPLAGIVRLVEWGTDDAPAFAAYNTAAQAWQTANFGSIDWDDPDDGWITLTLPAGRYIHATIITNSYPLLRGGLKKVRVQGASRTTTFISDCLGTQTFRLDPGGSFTYPIVDEDGSIVNGNHYYRASRTDTVSAGSSSIQLKVPAHASRFPVGDYGLMSGIDIQGNGGPANLLLFQWMRVAASDAGTGIITFTEPLTDSYKDTWPCFAPGSAALYDLGGPAALYPILPVALGGGWDMEEEFNDLAFSFIYSQTSASVRKVTFHNVNVAGVFGIFASQNKEFICSGTCDWSDSGMEFDKLVGSGNLDGLSISSLNFQSPGVRLLTVTNCIVGAFQGTPDNLIVSDSVIEEMRVGTGNLAGASSVTCNNCQVDKFGLQGVKHPGGGADIRDYYTFDSPGVIKTPMWEFLAPWAYPGSKLFFSGQYDNEGTPFACTDLTTDGEVHWVYFHITSGSHTINTVTASGADDDIFPADIVGKAILYWDNDNANVFTTVTGWNNAHSIEVADAAANTQTHGGPQQFIAWGHVYTHLSIDAWPDLPGDMRIWCHPCPNWHGTGNFGCDEILNLNNAGAQGKPVGSYSRRTYVNLSGYAGYPSHVGPDDDSTFMWGTLVQATYTVTVTGSGNFYPMGIFPGSATIDADGVIVKFYPKINTAVAGPRVVTPGGADPALSGDTDLTIPDPNWLVNGIGVYGEGSGTVVVEFITDQGYEGKTFTLTFT